MPIGSVTNGVHLPTWVHRRWAPIIDSVCGGDVATADTWDDGDSVCDEFLWNARNDMHANLVRVAGRSVHDAWIHRGNDETQLAWTNRVLPGRADRRLRPPRVHLPSTREISSARMSALLMRRTTAGTELAGYSDWSG